MYTIYVPGAHRGQKDMFDFLELELVMAVSYRMGLGIQTQVLYESHGALNLWTIPADLGMVRLVPAEEPALLHNYPQSHHSYERYSWFHSMGLDKYIYKGIY